MKLHSVKLPKRRKNKNEPELVGYNEDYPYGLRIRLQKEQIKAVPGADNLDVGSQVNISAIGKVISIHKDGNEESIEIQIQKIGIEGEKTLKDMSQAEYNKARNQGKTK